MPNRGSNICDTYMEKERTQMENTNFFKMRNTQKFLAKSTIVIFSYKFKNIYVSNMEN